MKPLKAFIYELLARCRRNVDKAEVIPRYWLSFIRFHRKTRHFDLERPWKIQTELFFVHIYICITYGCFSLSDSIWHKYYWFVSQRMPPKIDKYSFVSICDTKWKAFYVPFFLLISFFHFVMYFYHILLFRLFFFTCVLTRLQVENQTNTKVNLHIF